MRNSILLFILSAVFTSGSICAQDHQNLELVKQFDSWWSDFDFDMAVSGDYAYLAAGYYGLHILDVSDAQNPVQAGFWFPDVGVESVAVWDNYALVGSDNRAYILNIEDRFMPVEIGCYEIDEEENEGRVYDIIISENAAYLATNQQGVVILDVSNPDNPQLIHRIEIPSVCCKLLLQDDVLFVKLEEHLRIYNVSNLENPGLICEMEHPGSWGLGLVLSDDMLFISSWECGLQIFDVSDLEHPVRIGRYSSNKAPGMGVQVVGNVAFYAAGDHRAENNRWQGILALDVSDPRNIVQLDSLPGLNRNLIIQNDLAYVSGSNSLDVIDVSDPTDIQNVGSYNCRHSDVRTIDAVGNVVYIGTQGLDKIRSFDISDPEHPIQRGRITAMEEPRDVVIAGDFTYVCTMYGLTVLDISDPNDLRALDTLEKRYSRKLSYADETCYLLHTQNYNDSLSIIDVSDPDSVQLISTHSIGVGGFGNSVRHVAVEGDHGFLIWDHSEDDIIYSYLIVLDMSNPQDIDTLAQVRLEASILDIIITDDIAYLSGVSEGWTSVYICNVANPEEPVILGECQVGEGTSNQFYRRNLKLDDEYLYVACMDEGVRVVDVSDLENPQEAGYYDTWGFANEVDVQGNLVFVADDCCALILCNDLVSVKDRFLPTPSQFVLHPPYPNPFNSTTVLSYAIPQTGRVSLKLYDLSGREIHVLQDGVIQAGLYNFALSARDLTSGVCFAVLRSGSQVSMQKVAVIK